MNITVERFLNNCTEYFQGIFMGMIAFLKGCHFSCALKNIHYKRKDIQPVSKLAGFFR